MRFLSDAPGLLTPDGSTFYADWNVEADNFGYSQAAVEATISTALNDPLGWEQVPGIEFRHVDNSSRSATTVTYQVVETILPGDPSYAFAWGIFIPAGNDPDFLYPRIQIEAAHFADLGIPNHEAAHAFFSATHSPEGSDSLMEPYEDPGSEAPSATDLAQVEAWLSTYDPPNRPKPVDEGSSPLWFPADLPHYITHQTIPEGSAGRITATVLRGARVAIQALYHEDLSELLAGNGSRFSRGLDCYHDGFFRSPYIDSPSGNLYVGIVVDTEDPSHAEDLVIGLAEVQIRSS